MTCGVERGVEVDSIGLKAILRGPYADQLPDLRCEVVNLRGE